MQWVELIGPHGIGKTTIRKHLRKLVPPRAQSIDDLNAAIRDLNYDHPASWPVPVHWERFMQCVDDLYSWVVDRNQHKRRRKFCRAMFRMISIEQDARDGMDVRDLLGAEGMRLSFILRDPKRIKAYFETMPLSPLGVVVLHADMKTILQRNKLRAPGRDDLGIWTAKGIWACEFAADVLVKRTRVLYLDATRPVEDNAKAIAAFAGRGEE